MLNKIIKVSFAIVGAVTGFTITKTVLYVQSITVLPELKNAIFLVASLSVGLIFYLIGQRLVAFVLEFIDQLESLIQNMTLYELAVSAVGLIAGLIVANLVTLPINKIDIIGVPLSIIANILFGCIGISIALRKKSDTLFGQPKTDKGHFSSSGPKLVDTSVIIDGRIVDICRAGFMEGELVVPSFVLEELRHIADSSDSLKRNRGRRGLDVLNMLQKDLQYPVRIENIQVENTGEVDDKLLKAAAKFKGKVITLDYNLSKVASFQGVPVLNINELANAVKPIALPGEEMTVQVIKDGKENGQGVGYMDDGTMIVVDGGKKYVGEAINVTVTSVLQTAAGRMIFAKPKCQPEKMVSC